MQQHDRIGIARGTLYHYFPTRRALLEALEATALEEASRRLADAKLDHLAVEEALARAVRALVALDKTYLFLARAPHLGRQPGLVEPINALLERGRKHGEIRDDIPVACLVETLLVLIGACIRSGKAAGMGPEDVSLTGASTVPLRRPPAAPLTSLSPGRSPLVRAALRTRRTSCERPPARDQSPSRSCIRETAAATR